MSEDSSIEVDGEVIQRDGAKNYDEQYRLSDGDQQQLVDFEVGEQSAEFD